MAPKITKKKGVLISLKRSSFPTHPEEVAGSHKRCLNLLKAEQLSDWEIVAVVVGVYMS